MNIEKLIKRWEKLAEEKSQWHPLWDDLARVMLPRRMGFSTTTTPGDRRTADIFDSTPMQAALKLANVVGWMLRPDGLPEIKMRVEEQEINDTEEAKAWIAEAENRMRDAFNNPKARFRQAAGEADQDLVVFGTAVIYEGEATQRNHLLFQTLHLKDTTVFFNDEGAVEGLFRKRKMPIRDMETKFGLNKLSEATRKLAENDQDKRVDVLHAVVPRETKRKDPLFAKDLPYADYWLEIEAKHSLSDGGFHEFPFIVPRWDTASGEDYGRSPGMIALPDADTLQAMGETILIAGQRAADPPLAVPNDGAFDAINTFPGGLAYYDVETAAMIRGNPFFPIESGMNLPITRDMQEDTRNQVWAAFFRNILNLPIDGPEMTATEVIQRKEEFIREIGAIFGRLESDYTGPTVERAFMIMLRAGAFPPIPPILQGSNIRFEYESPVIKIRRQVEATAARMWVEEQVKLFLETEKVEILDTVNFDAHARFTAEALNIPSQIVNSQEHVEEVRKNRMEAMAAAQEAEMMEKSIMAAKTGAEVAEKTAKAQSMTQPAGA